MYLIVYGYHTELTWSSSSLCVVYDFLLKSLEKKLLFFFSSLPLSPCMLLGLEEPLGWGPLLGATVPLPYPFVLLDVFLLPKPFFRFLYLEAPHKKNIVLVPNGASKSSSI